MQKGYIENGCVLKIPERCRNSQVKREIQSSRCAKEATDFGSQSNETFGFRQSYTASTTSHRMRHGHSHSNFRHIIAVPRAQTAAFNTIREGNQSGRYYLETPRVVESDNSYGADY